MAADLNWKPIQYVEDGRLQGLSSEYVAAVERLTGLRFVLVPISDWDSAVEGLKRGELDVLPGVLRSFITPSAASLIATTRSYFVTTTVVVTREQGPVLFDLNRLDGHTVAFKGGGGYEAKVGSLYPEIKVLPTRTSEDALKAVIEGRAVAALDASVVFAPYLRRKYEDVLHVSGVVASLPMELTMGVREDLSILHGIIDKALASLTAKETDEMDARWFEEADYGAPSIPVMIRHYGPQLALGTLALLLIGFFALQARRQKRVAIRNEKEKTMFLAVLSHEVRSPMNAILASMELLTRETRLQPEAHRLLGVAMSGAENLLRLLDDVLDISKLEAGRLQLDLRPVDIVELLQSVIDLFKYKADEQGISLNFQHEIHNGYHLLLDRLRLGQILHNLLSNAIKFTSKGGVTICLTLRAAVPKSGKWLVEIRVVDTGLGMDENTRHRLFQPYAQASAATASKFGGTGLGLSICRQLTELMGGEISIESEPGRGSVVTVRIPCDMYAANIDSAANSVVPSATSGVSSTLRAVSVLLVEDTPANQMVLQAQLEALGCRPTLAPSGEEGLLELERGTYEIVLLDCDLPGISGYEVARQWRASESRRGIPPTPILAISAYTEIGHTTACFEAGMDGVLTKPIKLGTLRDALQLWSDGIIVPSEGEAVSVTDLASAWEALRADVHALRVAVDSLDQPSAMHYAHRLAGACSLLDQQDMATLAKALELQFKTDFPGAAQEHLEKLGRWLDQHPPTR
ncbi:hypothetical protein A7J71_20600 [Achromobacter insolitus]|uniref:ATP-binding protein n=1 Tax=Achromobacter insolitus TaxID=217204 RepID=UPI0007C873DC|nr:transporter substrate-binding domain-containing protein [Achromobacter insolitus]OAE71652.1 hypothetical protein A7J71_20600 [Achromobacter insolitus]OCZ52941.1 hypothetical protein A7P22_16250 [Achromobacter insolitus]